MKKKLHFLFLPLYILLLSNCAPTLELQSVETKPIVKVEKITKIDLDSTYILSGKRYRLVGQIEEVQYQPQFQQLAINYKTDRRKAAYAIYDLQKERLNWANRGDYRLALLKKDIVLVGFQEKQLLVDAERGLPIRWVNGEEFATIDDSITLQLGERFSSIDLRTGRTKWTRSGESRYDGWMADELDGDWMYVVANGLHGFNLNTGKGWHHRANTNYDATRGGKAVANGIMLGLNILSIASGGPVFDDFLYWDRLRAHNIYAKPKTDGANLYFADRKSIAKLDKTTGQLLWETNVREELGVSDLKILSKNRLLLFGKGYRYVDYALDKDKQANLYLIDANDGTIVKKETLPNREIITNHALNDAFIYVLTPSRIYQFDQQLNLLANKRLPATYGAPLRVVTWSSSRYDDDLLTDIPDFPLTVRTMQGVVGLHPVTLEELWYQRLGSPVQAQPQILNQDRWQLPILIQENEMRRSWIDERTETFWFAKAQKIIGLDLINNGAVVAEFDMESDDFWYVGEGEILQFGGRDIRVLRLDGN